MSTLVVLGAQWGDEGKGKLVDWLAAKSDMVVRFQGGNNAGHTLIINDQETVLHLIPSGIFYPHTQCIIGNGVVVDPEVCCKEIDQIQKLSNADLQGRLWISESAHVILPYHKRIDKWREKLRGKGKIGTTGRGVGPAYEDKMARVGIRMGELVSPERFRQRLETVLPEKNAYLADLLGTDGFDVNEILDSYAQFADRLRPFVTDAITLMYHAVDAGKHVMFEGAQGSALDIDHGTYPYVTSSNTTVGGVCTGSGLAPQYIKDVVGVCKAYVTRVGEGPFPSELDNNIGDKLQKAGGEFGATTGRTRRCGWLDLVQLKHAIRINGMNQLILTKLDVLSGMSNLKICTDYQLGNETIQNFPAQNERLKECQAIYKDFDGWDQDLSGIKSFKDLPAQAQTYIQFIEDFCKVPVRHISIGPGRDDIVER